MTELAVSAGVDKEAILRYLGLNPNDIATQTLLLIADRYGLDPIRKHLVLIEGKGGKPATPYVTRDGLLHVAHRSGHLDGIVFEEQGELDTHYWAIVSVWRDDMSHPFRFVGRYPKVMHTKHGDKPVEYGPEMAVKCAEVMGLRRAFDVDVPTVEERWDADVREPELTVDRDTLAELHDRVRVLPDSLRVKAQDFIRSTGGAADRVTVRQYERIDEWLGKIEAVSGEVTALEPGEETPDMGLPGVSDPGQSELDV